MKQRPVVTTDDIARGLRRLGVGGGGVILAHISLSSFGRVEGGAEAVIEALLAAVEPGGTVLVPTHTWDRINSANPVFDVRRTPSGVGRVTEAFRARPDALRSLHPTHSCAAIGPLGRSLLRDHETEVTPCGRNSPYQRLMECGGKVVFLGVTLEVNTSFHAIEEIAGVPWVFDRFEMLYAVDYDGKRIPVPSRRHTDDLDRAYEAMEPLLTSRGALVSGRIGAAAVRVIDSAAMERVLAPRLAEDPFMILSPAVAARERRSWQRWLAERPAP